MKIESIKIAVGQSLPMLELSSFIENEIAGMASLLSREHGNIDLAVENHDKFVTAKILLRRDDKSIRIAADGESPKEALTHVFHEFETSIQNWHQSNMSKNLTKIG